MTVSKAVDLRMSVMDNDEKITNLVNAASLLRAEIMSKRDTPFKGTFDNLGTPIYSNSS